MNILIDKETFENLYKRFNRREFVHPDPLEFLYDYDDARDRELVGLIASSLAYGRVAQILTSVLRVLDAMGEPARFMRDSSRTGAEKAFAGFKHRFATGAEMAALVWGAGRLVRESGSLEAAFLEGYSRGDETTVPALSSFAARLSRASGLKSHLLPCPTAGSACKRLHLFLRWMVRRDEVDPGGWDMDASKLIVPLDTHMQRMCWRLGLTERQQADMKTALEVTDAFRRFSPDDPVKYDFALTRLGIRHDEDPEEFLKAHSAREVA